MVLIVRKLTRPVVPAFGFIINEGVSEERQLHSLVISTHVILILVYTVLSVLFFNVYSVDNTDASGGVDTAWFFLGGIQDIFLAFMMFFVLNEEVNIFRDESTKIAYVVIDVINMEASQ
jgi:hypothetical protein